MCKIKYIFVLLLSYLTPKCFAYYCYSDFCHNRDTELTHSGPECLLTLTQRGKGCVNWRFENLGYTPPTGELLGKFRLSSYVHDFGEFNGRTTAFNLSMSDIKFKRLITRYQELGNDREAACRQIEIYGNNKELLFPEMFVSCPFSEDTFEAIPYRLEYLAIGDSFEYSRKLVFRVPRHISIDEDKNNVTTFTPFFYVDVSNVAKLSLHIQSLPKKLNVTNYKVWLINNETNSIVSINLNSNDQPEIQYNFAIGEGMHYFKVSAMHPSCGEYGCKNSTSPLISTRQPTRRILIMIVSVVWIPPVILYAMYQVYKLCMKNLLTKRGQRRMNCLLIYSPTHAAHVNVMEKLAIYMRSCNINAMIDMLSIPETVNKDPGLWCNSAFQSADVIVVATSPPQSDVVVPVIYRNMDNHALRLLKENYSRRNKRYFALQFPYCKRDDIPEEAKVFRRFEMPQDVDKLVRNIYHVDRVRFFGVSSKDLVDSIKVAEDEILRGKATDMKIIDDTAHNSETRISDELLPLQLEHNTNKLERQDKCDDSNRTLEDAAIRQYFRTNIDELNLLGDNGESDTFIYTPQQSDTEFRIDRLRL